MATALITLHAAAGLVAVAAGWLAITRGSALGLYFWSLTACIALVAGAVAVDWSGLDGGSRVLFLALLALGGYMIFRGSRARRRLALAEEMSEGFVDDVGFTLIALVDAFVVILALDLGASGAVAAAIALLVAALGHWTLVSFKRGSSTGRRSVTRPPRPAHRR